MYYYKKNILSESSKKSFFSSTISVILGKWQNLKTPILLLHLLSTTTILALRFHTHHRRQQLPTATPLPCLRLLMPTPERSHTIDLCPLQNIPISPCYLENNPTNHPPILQQPPQETLLHTINHDQLSIYIFFSFHSQG